MKVEDLVYRTPSEFDAILLLTNNEVLYAKEGMYGGWMVSKKLEKIDTALWCFKRDIENVKIDDVMDVEVVRRFVEELKNLNVGAPSVRKVTYYYRPVEVTIKKSNDRYTVIDIVPKPITLRATAIHLYWRRHYSRKGNVFGDLCNADERDRVRLTAKMLGLEAYDTQVGSRDFELRVKVVTNTKDLEEFLKQR